LFIGNDDEDEEMIDTTSKNKQKSIRDVHMKNNDDQEIPTGPSKTQFHEETKENPKGIFINKYPIELPDNEDDLFRFYLQEFYKEAKDDNSLIVQSLKILTKVINNLIQNPWETKYRTLDTTKKAIKEKLAKYKNIVAFLCVCSFEEKEENLVLKGYPGELLNKAYNAILAELKENQSR